jgi:hypothetical protein
LTIGAGCIVEDVVEFDCLCIGPIFCDEVDVLEEIKPLRFLAHLEVIHSVLVLSLFQDQTLRKNLIIVKASPFSILNFRDDDILENSDWFIDREKRIVVTWGCPLGLSHFSFWLVNEFIS